MLFQGVEAGLSPAGNIFIVFIAQLVEQFFCKEQATGSIPVEYTK